MFRARSSLWREASLDAQDKPIQGGRGAGRLIVEGDHAVHRPTAVERSHRSTGSESLSRGANRGCMGAADRFHCCNSFGTMRFCCSKAEALRCRWSCSCFGADKFCQCIKKWPKIRIFKTLLRFDTQPLEGCLWFSQLEAQLLEICTLSPSPET